MKKGLFFTTLMLSSHLALAGVNSINPDKIITPLFKVFGSAKIKNNTVEVRGPRLVGQEELEDEGSWPVISLATYTRAKKLAESVFVTDSGESSEIHGTSFSIGNNLILTNQHVLSPSRKNSTKCQSFSLHTNDKSSEEFDCKEVLFCDATRDFCLIEVKVNTSKKRINGQRVTVESHLARVPSLQLDPNYKFENSGRYSTKNFTVIGNTKGFGIHYSEGKEAHFISKDFWFFTPLASGNSGGPLLNEAGNVIGIVKQQSSTFSGTETDVYNVAVPIAEVVETLKEKLQNRPEVIAKLNKALVSP
jgi:V8-like Glu-specific endopeptidase